MNPLLIGGAAAGLLALLLFGRPAKAAQPKPSERMPYTKPVELVEQQAVRVAICEAAGGGTITVLVEPLASQLWGKLYPGVPWPTRPDDHPTVIGAESAMRAEIAAYLLDPAGYCEATGDNTIVLDEVETVDEPQPGYMYQMKQNEIVGGSDPEKSLVYRALMRGGMRAAMDAGADEAQAASFGKALASSAEARARYRNLLYCDLLNDLYYGTYGYDASYGAGGPNGRRFRSLPQHEDNRTRIAMGLSPMRRMPLMTPADQGKGNATAKFGKLPYLHFPLLDYEQLMNTNLPIDARIVYGEYSDGSSGAYPPPSIQRVMSTIGLPSAIYGCTGPGYESMVV